MIWTKEIIESVISVLKTSNSVANACRSLSQEWGEYFTPKALTCAMRRFGYESPAEYLDPAQERSVVRKWTEKDLKHCVPVLRKHGSVNDACVEISQMLGRDITITALRKAFVAAGMKPPLHYLDKNLHKEWQKQRALKASRQSAKANTERARMKHGWTPNRPSTMRATKTLSAGVANSPSASAGQVQDNQKFKQSLLASVQKATQTINELADKFDVAPKNVRQTLSELQSDGYGISVENDQIVSFGIKTSSDIEDAKEISAKPLADGTFCFGAISDTHFGSKYCDEEAFINYVEYAYATGVRHILHAGDVLTGLLSHHGMSYEIKVLGFDNQVEDALRIMPQKPGLHYWMISGNHEINSYWKAIGMSPGYALMRRAREIGRSDIHHIGDIQGRVVFGHGEQSIKIELAHPKASGNTYAISYPVQKWVERMPGGAKPHILISGHLHVFAVLNTRNVVCIQPGCFEHSTPFTREMGLHPAVGGVIIWAKRDGLNLWFRNEWVATRTKPVDWTQIE